MAIPKHLKLEFVTPERAIVHDEVDEVELPGEEGYLGILPGHAPLLAALKTGEMWYRKGTDRKYAFLAGGFAEIVPDRVSILAQVAERAEDIDLARAEASKRRAEERLAKPTSEIDYERARIALLRALTRLQVSTRHPRARG
ncbi:MAG TPA: F0F1 ATP synthase subunit epsilon [Vicinamibacterales bacterium]|nr:F0F1 ATP synthase subunit epsilon [Vicinamibacterales bacterium]